MQKSLLYWIRGSRFSSSLLRTSVLRMMLRNAHCIKRVIVRNPLLRRNFSPVPFSTDHRLVGQGDRARTMEQDEQYDESLHEEHQFMKGPNPGLASVISQGIKSLEHTAEEIQYKTRKITLSQPHKRPSFRNGRAAELDPRQLAEGQRILDVASDCLEQLTLQNEKNSLQQSSDSNGLVLFGEPIVLLDCEVNRNVRQARIYWTLPYGILLDNRINQRLYQEIMAKVQKQLVENGGAKLLARDVHTRLSYYYPPRIKLFPATDEMVQKAIHEFME